MVGLLAHLLVNLLGGLGGNINANLAQGFDGVRVDPGGNGAGAFECPTFWAERLRQPLRHLRSAGISGAEKKDLHAFIMRPVLFQIQVLLIGMLLLWSASVFSEEDAWPYPMKKFTYSQRRLERFFDLNKDKLLSLYERNLITTQKHFGWPLASSKKRKKFDSNGDNILQPYEYHLYKKGQKNKDAQYKPVPIRH